MQQDSDPNERTMIARRGPMPPAPTAGPMVAPRRLAIVPRSPAEALEPQRAPAPPRRKIPRRAPGKAGSVLRFVNGLMTFALMMMIMASAGYYGIKHLFDRPGPLGHSTVLVIPKGESVNEIARRMERDGIIDDARVFSGAVLLARAHNKLKAGEYAIPKGASTQKVLDTLIEGRSLLYKASFREGLTSSQIVERLKETADLTGDVETMPAEGALLPETYTFARGTNRQDLLNRMQADQQKFLKGLWEKRDPSVPLKTPEDALILASIIEKETGRADERDKVAAVFMNRLRKGMRLQSDPTIIYGIAGGKGTLGRGLLRSEIDQPTPYNTYQINGLPPSPICNPGKDAILATLNPAKSDDLYFVANGTGGHAFAKTLAEHNKNVQVWRQIERDSRQQQQAAEPDTAATIAPAPQPAAPAPAQKASKAAAKAPDAAAATEQKPAADAKAAAEQKEADVPLPSRKPKR